MKETVWPRTKFPNYDSAAGKHIKKWMQQELGLSDLDYENKWQGNKGIRSDINHTLRELRAYVVQQMKTCYNSEFSAG